MFTETLENLRSVISGKNAKRYVAEITQYHRIQATEGYDHAALRCKEILEGNGIETELLEYPSDGETMYLGFVSPQGWSVEKGILSVDGKEYADFEKEPLSLIQRSIPFEGDVDLIYAEKEKEFKRGFLVFTHDFKKGKEYARHYHCLGIVTDENRSRFDAPDSRQYLSFWGEQLFGFVISPREGAKLEKELKKGKKKAHVEIQSSLHPGKMTVVSARIPGETDEELLLIAHLCHPTPGGNDNASGVGLALEVARILTKMEKPKRSIRLLFVPEIHGTAAFIAENRAFLCGLNLDMVGENQQLCNSSLLVEKTPDATPFFGNHLLEAILEEIKKETANLLQTAQYPLFLSSVTPFSGGSDHWILSDPTVDIPTPMIIHWPDTFYHTNFDTIDKVDEKELERVGVLAATYLSFIASMGEKETAWTARLITQKAKERIVRAALNGPEIPYIAEVEMGALESLKRMGEIDLRGFKKEIEEVAAAEMKRTTQKKREKSQKGFVPKRISIGPISLSKTLSSLPLKERKKYDAQMEKYTEFKGSLQPAVFWADGKRDIHEIAERVTNEIGKCHTDFLQWYFAFLEDHGLIEIER
jgi:hypothetical protein